MKIFLLLCFLLLSTGCDSTDDPALQRSRWAAKNTGDIKIGLATSFAEASLLEEGVAMAVEELNNRPNKLLGRKVVLEVKDDKGNLEEGQRIAQNFADDPDIIAVIGHIYSSISIAVSTTYNYYGILMLSPASTATRFTQQSYKLVFRNIVTDKEIGKQLARFVKQQIGPKKKQAALLKKKEEELKEEDLAVKVMIFNARDDYGRGLANEFEKEAQAIGVVVLDRRSYDVVGKKVNVKNELKQWEYRKNDFDAIFIAGVDPEATAIIRQIREMGFKHPICGGDGLGSQQVIDGADSNEDGISNAEGLVVALPNNFDETGNLKIENKVAAERTQRFIKNMQEKEDKLADAWAAQGYDAVMVLAQAIDDAQTTEPDRVAEALRNIKGWQGVTGPHTFDENGDVTSRYKDKDGKEVDGKKIGYLIVKDGEFKRFTDKTTWEYSKK